MYNKYIIISFIYFSIYHVHEINRENLFFRIISINNLYIPAFATEKELFH